MPVTREGSRASLIDVLDRVLDKGIVIDAWVRVALVGIDLIAVHARVTVASIDTYLRYSDLLANTLDASRIEHAVSPALRPKRRLVRGHA